MVNYDDMSHPLVTVAVAAYNRSSLLACALESIQMQTMEDFEVWVVGDGCTDGSERVVASINDKRFRWHNLARNTGSQSGPNNEAIRRAKGAFIAYLNQDDLWLPWHLDELLKRAVDSDADLVYGGQVIMGPEHRITEVFGSIGPQPDCNVVARQQDSWLHPRGMAEEYGFWREDYWNLAEYTDSEFFRRLCRGGARFEYVDVPTVLRFPSAAFSNYSAQSEAVQLDWLERLRGDRLDVEQELGRMALAALALGGLRSAESRLNRLKKAAANLPLDILVRLFGQWGPVSYLRVLRQRRARKRYDRERGLN
jgi:glycosyltransferase involved in cell wall biosynthesis